MKKSPLSILMFFVFILQFSTTYAEYCGKVDIGPAYIHLDVLESGKTTHRMDMGGFKGDATIVLKKGYGFALKPSLLYGNTGNNEEIVSGGIGFGHCTPIGERFVVTPSIGILYTYVKTKTDIQTPFIEFKDLKEKFNSYSPYLSIDITYKIADCWRICGVYQYSISRTRTHIKKSGLFPGVFAKGHSQGPSYALLLERDFNEKFSVNLGVGYNLSLSKEKHGLRGMGVKLGLAYWF